MGTSLESGRDASSKPSRQPSRMRGQLGAGSSGSRPACSRHQWGPPASPWPPAQPAGPDGAPWLRGSLLHRSPFSPSLWQARSSGNALQEQPSTSPATATADGGIAQLPPPPGGTAPRCLHSASQDPDKMQRQLPAVTLGSLLPAVLPFLPPLVLPGPASPTDRLRSDPCLRITSGGTQAKTPPSSPRLQVLCTSPGLERGHPCVVCFPRDSGPAVLIMNTCDLTLDVKSEVRCQPRHGAAVAHPACRRVCRGAGFAV